MTNDELRSSRHLEIYAQAYILLGDNNTVKNVWFEGKQSEEAQSRYQIIREAFSKGFLDGKIEAAKSASAASVFEAGLSKQHREALEKMVNSITAQRGRALVEILVLQLAVKSVCPEQDVRLHKGSKSSRDQAGEGKFSWREGISMRRLDDTYIVPILRKHGLLRMNEYGAFMTRTFAENYPYTLFYKAEISGAKRRWLEIVDELEEGRLDPDAALLYVLSLLWRSSELFRLLTEKILNSLEAWLIEHSVPSLYDVSDVIKEHINSSEARARLLEVAMHAFLQALEDVNVDLGGNLKSLMPMRTANQKHRNFGDVEVVLGDTVIESWDAKYDNPYLSDALDVFVEKFRGKNITELNFGYVLLPEKKDYQDVERKIADIADEYGVDVHVLSFDEWIQQQGMKARSDDVTEEMIASAWLRAYVESLALRRAERAPIDEPTHDWLQTLLNVLQ